MNYKILCINPGSTSTKIALWEDKCELFSTTIRHTDEELAPFNSIAQQYDFRKEVVLGALHKAGYSETDLSAVVGRGGLFPNIQSGTYRVNESMKSMVHSGTMSPHASNLGAIIADAVAAPLGIPAFVCDCVTSDEMMDVARYAGLPFIRREAASHVLNAKAMARKCALSVGNNYENMNFIIAHLGGGISIAAHCRGRIVDCTGDDQGAFSPERAGGIPSLTMLDLCYSGTYSKQDLGKLIRGNGGMKAYLGTSDCIEIEKRISEGDDLAKHVYEAQAYQVARGICGMLPALKNHVDAVIITGGIAYSTMLTTMISDFLGNVAPVQIMPGENEMEALTLGALRVLCGEEAAKIYEPID